MVPNMANLATTNVIKDPAVFYLSAPLSTKHWLLSSVLDSIVMRC
jgi:hypothetical protein